MRPTRLLPLLWLGSLVCLGVASPTRAHRPPTKAQEWEALLRRINEGDRCFYNEGWLDQDATNWHGEHVRLYGRAAGQARDFRQRWIRDADATALGPLLYTQGFLAEMSGSYATAREYYGECIRSAEDAPTGDAELLTTARTRLQAVEAHLLLEPAQRPRHPRALIEICNVCRMGAAARFEGLALWGRQGELYSGVSAEFGTDGSIRYGGQYTPFERKSWQVWRVPPAEPGSFRLSDSTSGTVLGSPLRFLRPALAGTFRSSVEWTPNRWGRSACTVSGQFRLLDPEETCAVSVVSGERVMTSAVLDSVQPQQDFSFSSMLVGYQRVVFRVEATARPVSSPMVALRVNVAERRATVAEWEVRRPDAAAGRRLLGGEARRGREQRGVATERYNSEREQDGLGNQAAGPGDQHGQQLE